MVRTFVSLLAVGLILFGGTRMSGDTTFRSAYHDYRIVTVVEALVQPWSIAFLPGGDILITERPGRLRIVRQGKLLPQPVDGVPKVFHSSQGGLLEVAPHPGFASNRWLYLTYSKPLGDGKQSTTALIRGRFENDRLSGIEQLFELVSQGRGHFGGKIALFYTGDRFPQWKGNLFVGGMAGQRLARLTMEGPRVVNEETLAQRMGRIRDVRQGPDGYIYLVTDDREGKPTPVLRMEPVEQTTTK